MKKMNLFAVLITALTFSLNVSAQIVVNGDFEQASGPGHPNNATNWDRGCSQNYFNTSGWFQGTSDLYTASVLPAQNRVNPRLAGSYNFAGMIGPRMSTINGQPTLVRRESVINEVVNGPFVTNRIYTISFYAARAYFGNIGQQTNIQMEALLRVSGDCTQEKLIPININVPIQNYGQGSTATNNWTYLTATFSLTQAEAAAQFDAIEIRPKYDGVDYTIEHIFVDDLNLSYIDNDPCPEELDLSIDCASGEISVTNIPPGATVHSTQWIKKKKINGLGVVILSGPTSLPTVTTQGNGFYEVTMTMTFADGTECSVTGIVFYSEDDCCLITHPNGLEAWLGANNNIVGYQTVTACGTTFNVPIICNASREYYFDISLCPGVEGYSIFNAEFNPVSCSDINTLYSTAGSGTIPSSLTLNASQYQAGAINNLTIYATDPGLNPNSQSVNILYIPHHPDHCSGQLGRTKSLVSSEDEVKELEITTIHPNPANDFTTVAWNETASGKVGIYTMDGRELNAISFDDQSKVTLSTTNLPKGIYIVQLIVNNRTITKKLVKE